MPLPSVFIVTADKKSLKSSFCPSYRQAPRVNLLHLPSFFLLSPGFHAHRLTWPWLTTRKGPRTFDAAAWATSDTHLGSPSPGRLGLLALCTSAGASPEGKQQGQEQAGKAEAAESTVVVQEQAQPPPLLRALSYASSLGSAVAALLPEDLHASDSSPPTVFTVAVLLNSARPGGRGPWWLRRPPPSSCPVPLSTLGARQHGLLSAMDLDHTIRSSYARVTVATTSLA